MYFLSNKYRVSQKSCRKRNVNIFLTVQAIYMRLLQFHSIFINVLFHINLFIENENKNLVCPRCEILYSSLILNLCSSILLNYKNGTINCRRFYLCVGFLRVIFLNTRSSFSIHYELTHY